MMPVVFQRSKKLKDDPETRFTREIRKYLKLKFGSRIKIFKISGGAYQEPGIPDLICCLDGKFLALEIKNPESNRWRLGQHQKRQIEEIREAKGVAEVVQSWKDLDTALAKV